MRSDALSDATKDFSLVLGGPLYQFLVRVGLVRPPLDRAASRIIVITLFARAPLLLLTALGGRLASGLKVPFLYDIEAHCRLLAALPLLIGAEVAIHKRMRMMILQFVERQTITPSTLPKFEGVIGSALRLRNSPIIELGLLALVFVVGNLWMKGVLAIQSDTWYGMSTAGKKVLTPDGYWYEFVSLPIVHSSRCAGISGCSSGAGCSGRFPGWTSTWCRAIPTAAAGWGFLEGMRSQCGHS